MLTTIIESFDTSVIVAKTSSSITLPITGNGLKTLPISTATAYGLATSDKIIFEIFMQKYYKCKKHCEKDQRTFKFFVNSYRKSLQVNLIDKNENESLCNIFTKLLDETKNEPFFYKRTRN